MGPGEAPSPARDREQSARAYLEYLEQQLAAHLAEQARISNAVEKIHADLLAAAQEMRGIKVRANEVSVAGEANRQALAAIEAEILEQRNVVLECEKEAMEEARKVANLRDALAEEKQVREKERAAAEEARARAVAEEARKAEAVRTALTREQQLRERDQAMLKEREKQIEDLRLALEERDKLLRSGRVTTASPTPPPQPAAAASAKEAERTAPPPDTTAAARLVATGNTRLRENRLDEAEKAFRDALAISPEMVGARVGLAACAYTRANLDEARRLVQQVLGEDPRNAQALGLQGLIYWREGNMSEATTVLQKAVRQDPTDSQLQNYLGIVLFERKRGDAAREALRKAVSLDPSNAEARFNLAVVLASGSRPLIEEARTHYEEAIRLGSEHDEALDQILARPANP